MPGPVTIDTPDYQRGVVNAQVLLATVAAGTHTVTVGVPPNAESIMISLDGGAVTAGNAAMVGVSTGALYAGAAIKIAGSPFTSAWVFDAAEVVDAQVNVSVPSTWASGWHVYADAGVHVVADTANLRNEYGQLYVIPSIPSTTAGDHPPSELQSTCQLALSSGSVVLATPGAGRRYRIFYATVSTTDGVIRAMGMNDSVSGVNFCAGDSINGAQVSVSYQPSGLPLSSNAAVQATSSAGNVNIQLVYTTESV